MIRRERKGGRERKQGRERRGEGRERERERARERGRVSERATHSYPLVTACIRSVTAPLVPPSMPCPTRTFPVPHEGTFELAFVLHTILATGVFHEP